MKKIVAIVAAIVFCFALTSVAFAQSSVSVGGVITEVDATDAAGNAVDVTITNQVDDSTVAALTPSVVKDVAGDKYADGMQVVDVCEVTAAAGTQFPLTLVFEVTGVTANDTVGALHFNGQAWEYISGTAGEGTVTIVTDSCSPFAIVVAQNVPNPGTGDLVRFAPYAILAVAAAACAIVVFRKKA